MAGPAANRDSPAGEHAEATKEKAAGPEHGTRPQLTRCREDMNIGQGWEKVTAKSLVATPE